MQFNLPCKALSLRFWQTIVLAVVTWWARLTQRITVYLAHIVECGGWAGELIRACGAGRAIVAEWALIAGQVTNRCWAIVTVVTC